MARQARNKTTLGERERALRSYRHVLPSLDLKRRQLAALLRNERRTLAEGEARLQAGIDDATARLPMLAHIDEGRLARLLAAGGTSAGQDTVLGVVMPSAEVPPQDRVERETWATPAWYDVALDTLARLVDLQREIDCRHVRAAALAAALRRTVQRVNLFELQLIPQAEHAVRDIRQWLADLERAAVVRAKGARARRQRAASEEPR